MCFERGTKVLKRGHNKWQFEGADDAVWPTWSIPAQKCQESIHPFASVAADFSANLSELTSEKFSWRLMGCHAGQVAERGSNCLWQVPCVRPEPPNTGAVAGTACSPHAHHAMPPWPVWACVHKQNKRSHGIYLKCRRKVGLWLITPHLWSIQMTVQHLPMKKTNWHSPKEL